MEYIKKHKKGFIIGGSVLVILLIVGFACKFKHKSVIVPSLEDRPFLSAPEILPVKKLSVKKAALPSTDSKIGNLTYTEAYAKYHDGAILQFDENCQSYPNNLVIKSGSSLMLDNRGSSAETIKIGDIGYSLDARGFKIIVISVSAIPTTYTIDCKLAQNVNTLTVE